MRHNFKTPTRIGGKPELNDRNKSIYRSRISGLTYAQVGEMYKLTGQRIRQICLRIERTGRNYPDWFIHEFNIKTNGKEEK